MKLTYVALAIGVSLLIAMAEFAWHANSDAALTSVQLDELPADVRNAAVDEHNIRMQLHSKTLLYAFSGSETGVTEGDVTRAKLALETFKK